MDNVTRAYIHKMVSRKFEPRYQFRVNCPFEGNAQDNCRPCYVIYSRGQRYKNSLQQQELETGASKRQGVDLSQTMPQSPSDVNSDGLTNKLT